MSGDTLVREPAEATDQPETPPSPTGQSAGRLVFGGLLLLFGVLWLIEAAGVADLRWQVVLPAALTMVGVALLVTARRGAHGGLVAAGIILSVLVLVSAAVPMTTPLAGVGDRTEKPMTLADAGPGYELGMGKLTVDLRELAVPASGADLSASVGMGELIVRLPAGVGAEIRANSGAGEVVILGTSHGGIGVSVTEQVPGTPRLALDLSAGMGKVEVRR